MLQTKSLSTIIVVFVVGRTDRASATHVAAKIDDEAATVTGEADICTVFVPPSLISVTPEAEIIDEVAVNIFFKVIAKIQVVATTHVVDGEVDAHATTIASVASCEEDDACKYCQQKLNLFRFL